MFIFTSFIIQYLHKKKKNPHKKKNKKTPKQQTLMVLVICNKYFEDGKENASGKMYIFSIFLLMHLNKYSVSITHNGVILKILLMYSNDIWRLSIS